MEKKEFPGTRIAVQDNLESCRWALINVTGRHGVQGICFLHEPPLEVQDKKDGYTYFPVPLNTKILAVETTFERNNEFIPNPSIVLTVAHFSEEEGFKTSSLFMPIPATSLL